jgi:hypothetical protein
MEFRNIFKMLPFIIIYINVIVMLRDIPPSGSTDRAQQIKLNLFAFLTEVQIIWTRTLILCNRSE